MNTKTDTVTKSTTGAAETVADQIRFICTARLLLKPLPVRLHHVPKWMDPGLKRAIKALNVDTYRVSHDAFSRLSCLEAALDLSDWLDHWGSINTEYGTYFVSEPYGFTPSWAPSINRLCEFLGARWQVESNSWHYPGHTVRILIYPILAIVRYAAYEYPEHP